jgi:hypothetical protein
VRHCIREQRFAAARHTVAAEGAVADIPRCTDPEQHKVGHNQVVVVEEHIPADCKLRAEEEEAARSPERHKPDRERHKPEREHRNLLAVGERSRAEEEAPANNRCMAVEHRKVVEERMVLRSLQAVHILQAVHTRQEDLLGWLLGNHLCKRKKKKCAIINSKLPYCGCGCCPYPA